MYSEQLREKYGDTGVPIWLYPCGYALVDPEDYERVAHHDWILQRDQRGFYASCKLIKNGRTVYRRLHRVVTECVPEQSILFKNGDGLDCRRCNLAVWTYSNPAIPL